MEMTQNLVRLLKILIPLSIASVFMAPAFLLADEGCVGCHQEKTRGFTQGHAFLASQCTTCHQGEGLSSEKTDAHRGLIGFPGNLSNAEKTCGGCHAEHVANVRNGFMHTGKGMVHITQNILGENELPDSDLQHLRTSPADTLLRKLCAGCHLGQDKTRHELDAIKDRGGGCLACHINSYPKDAHPELTAKVSHRRCFGCHSRSSRISMNYSGLAEVDERSSCQMNSATLGRLPDGRVVERVPADIHFVAKISCIDCHTVRGIMGSAEGMRFKEEAVDIACGDCHDNHGLRVRLENWPPELAHLRTRIPFRSAPGQQFLRTEKWGTPLWNIEVKNDSENRVEEIYLHYKTSEGRIRIPQYSQASHPFSKEHNRLDCAACHSQWAPQCFGCHLSYSDGKKQWDHTQDQATAGRWQQRRWNIHSGQPTLGLNTDNRISPFIPGMVMTLAHPSWSEPRFRRLFASISPHTIGRARNCESCHRSPLALGLGQGTLRKQDRIWRFLPIGKILEDGLAEDAWTTLDSPQPGGGSRPGERSFSGMEIQHILSIDLP
jgi:hypothetical protein